jgi:hypothetical protein
MRYQTRMTYAGEDTLRQAAEPRDAVVLDLAMPGMDGGVGPPAAGHVEVEVPTPDRCIRVG